VYIAPPQEAEFEIIVQSIAATMEYSAWIAPPPYCTEFAVIVQSVAVMVESPLA